MYITYIIYIPSNSPFPFDKLWCHCAHCMMNVLSKALDECPRLFSRCAREASSRMLNCRLQPKAQLNKLREAARGRKRPQSIRESHIPSQSDQAKVLP